MAITDDRTPRLNLPLPVRTNELQDDCDRLRETLTELDKSVAVMGLDVISITHWSDLVVGNDWTPAFEAAAAWGKAEGGACISIPKGKFFAKVPLVSGVYWEGAGRGATIITQPNGANRDIVVSEGFETLKAVGPLVNAPKDFGISKLTVDGNYLADYRGASIGGDTVANNTAGFGLKVIGTKFLIDIELVNCAQVGAYFEAYDYTNYDDEQSSTIRIDGRVFGKEAIIYRGPADVNIEHVIIGSVGWLPTLAERQNTIVYSDIYPGEVVDVMVSDENIVSGSNRYNGHHEFGMLHLYGNLSGIGYRARGTGRIKGNHMVCENCRGGAFFDSRTWGAVSILECHNNGREPSALAGTLAIIPDIETASLQGLTINAVVRRAKTQAATYLALKCTGQKNKVTLNYFTIAPIPDGSPVIHCTGTKNDFDVTLADVSGDAIIVDAVGNDFRINGSNVLGGALVHRIAGATSQNRGNKFDIIANNTDAVFNADGLVTNEVIRIAAELTATQVINSGTAFDFLVRNPIIDVSARIGSTAVSSRRNGRVNLDNTVTTEQTIAVNHGFFQTPDPAMVTATIYDPSPTYAGALEYEMRIQSVTATQVVFVYKLKSIGTGGPLVLCWKVSAS